MQQRPLPAGPRGREPPAASLLVPAHPPTRLRVCPALAQIGVCTGEVLKSCCGLGELEFDAYGRVITICRVRHGSWCSRCCSCCHCCRCCRCCRRCRRCRRCGAADPLRLLSMADAQHCCAAASQTGLGRSLPTLLRLLSALPRRPCLPMSPPALPLTHLTPPARRSHPPTSNPLPSATPRRPANLPFRPHARSAPSLPLCR